jgi:hypothetical protein
MREASRQRPRKRESRLSTAGIRRKLSTLTYRELTELQGAIGDVACSIAALSPPGRKAIRAYFRRKRLVDRRRVCLGPTFQQTLDHAWEALLLLLAACIQRGEKGLELPPAVQPEVACVGRALERLMGAGEGIGQATREVLDRTVEDLGRPRGRSKRGKAPTADPLKNGVAWLALLGSIAERPRIEVKRGRAEAAERGLVQGLAELYRMATGQEPSRVYRSSRTRRGDPRGETGDFLELAQALARYARNELGDPDPAATSPFSKIVREGLAERRSRRPTRNSL